MKAIVGGADELGIGEELESQGVEVTRLESPIFAEALDDAGVADSDLFVLTDAEEAIAFPLAKELNPDVKAVFFGSESVPESVSGVVDLVVDPALLGADVVAEELAGNGE